jgi:hypothetical protein
MASFLVNVFLFLSFYYSFASADTSDGALKFGLINGATDFFKPILEGWVHRCRELGVTLFYIRDGKAKNRKLKFESNESRILPRSHIEVHNFYFRTIFTMTTIISLLYCYNPHQQHISSITT